MSNKNGNIIVVGAGASGMATAIEAARRGIDVTMLEANSEVGKKIYATGNGRCNLTNKNMSHKYYRSSSMAFVKEIIESFGCCETLEWFKELGLLFKDRDGYIYPRSGQASAVAHALYTACLFYGVHIICDSPVRSIEKQGSIFCVRTEKKEYRAKGVVLACGSMAGINKDRLLKVNGYDLAKSLGHSMVPVVSALTGLQCENKKFYKAVSGVRCDGTIELWVSNNANNKDSYERKSCDEGELQLTSYGVSGIPAFQVSRFAAYGIREKKSVQIKIDFLSDMTVENIIEMIEEKGKRNNRITILQCFTGVLNDKLAKALIEQTETDIHKKACETDRRVIVQLAETIKAYTDNVTAVNDFTQAQVLAGGVKLDEFETTMESVLASNLYVTGEMLDADGMCGGYNLQWAWATGCIAGRNILK